MSHKDDLKKLLVTSQRRLQKLKEQKALKGSDTPPHILIEIEDTEEEINRLQTELQKLESDDRNKFQQSIAENLLRTLNSAPLDEALFELEQFASDQQLVELKQWAITELDGYVGRVNSQNEIPEYRKLSVEWVDRAGNPLVINDSRLGFLRHYRMPHSVRDLQASFDKEMMIQPTNVLDLLNKLSGATIYGGRVESSKIQVLLGRIRAEAIRKLRVSIKRSTI